MSYLVLARKSRPQNFVQVVGQQHIVRTLRNALLRNRVPHALIFSGVRGTGKTTLARIMAKALNCESGQPPEPCCACRSCKEIAAGSSVDLHEIDGASNRGIQEIRELKENIRFMPVMSRFKIIIIDEVHMLTTEAFNALLKTLEEPPSHVYFMFATTELHKVPVTILSRCQRYELKRVASKELAAHFARLAESEGITMEPAALNMVVRAAGGSVRDGLSLLDQLFSYCGEQVTAADAAEVLGMVGGEVIAGTAKALLTGDLAAALDRLETVTATGMDIKRFINELLAWFRSLVVCRVSKDPAQLLDLPADELALLQETAASHSAQTLFLLFNLLMESLEKAAWSSRPRFAVEMAFIRAVQAEDIVPVTELLGRLDSILAGVALPQTTEPVALYDKKKTVVPERSVAKASEPPPAPPLPEEDDIPHPAEQPPSLPPQKVAAGERDIRKDWPDFIKSVKKPWIASALEKAASVHLENGRLILTYHDSIECSTLKIKEQRAELTALVSDFFQESLSVVFDEPKACGLPAESGGAEAVRKERQSLANDPLVVLAAEIFNGQVGDIRVGPQYKKLLAAAEETTEGSDEA
ncbi:MAG: DNA polymerase III, tau subunit [Candidatus Electronema aureum]|uniref:DNA polymerase III subunit gamma/tau n=1 Tax=Candidatus Electronema aureum TaxID=2005002 RepID=A0A521FZH8_9BACT|nr:MAG: DNA polymerase III, tau subunit [Candidatus Electronema aureum]